MSLYDYDASQQSSTQLVEFWFQFVSNSISLIHFVAGGCGGCGEVNMDEWEEGKFKGNLKLK